MAGDIEGEGAGVVSVPINHDEVLHPRLDVQFSLLVTIGKTSIWITRGLRHQQVEVRKGCIEFHYDVVVFSRSEDVSDLWPNPQIPLTRI